MMGRRYFLYALLHTLGVFVFKKSYFKKLVKLLYKKDLWTGNIIYDIINFNNFFGKYSHHEQSICIKIYAQTGIVVNDI